MIPEIHVFRLFKYCVISNFYDDSESYFDFCVSFPPFMTTMNLFQSHSGFHRTVCLAWAPWSGGPINIPSLIFASLTFGNLFLTYSHRRPVLCIPFMKFFMRPSFMCKGSRYIFSVRTRGGLTTFFSPGISDVRLSHSSFTCPGCPTHTGNSSILCTWVAFQVTVPQPSDHYITST